MGLSMAMQFRNDDGCGDWIGTWGETGQFEVQYANTISSAFFFLSGQQLLHWASSPQARAYGVANYFIALGAIFFHSTSTVVGFVADMVAIASCSTLLISGGVRAVKARLGHDIGSSESVQIIVPMVVAFVAVSVPVIMLVGGVAHPDVWGAWAPLSPYCRCNVHPCCSAFLR